MLKEETEQYKVIKTNSWYDPEGLDIDDKKVDFMFTGSKEDCMEFLKDTREALIQKYADRKDIDVSPIKERKKLDHIEKVGPFGYKQIWKEGPGIQYFEVYFRSAISKEYYSVVKVNDQAKQESLDEDYKKDKLWLVEKILEHTVRRAYLTKDGEFEVFSSVEDPTIKDKCELFTYDEAIAKKKEIQDKYPNDIIWVWYSGDVQIDPDKTKTTVVYNGKEYNED